MKTKWKPTRMGMLATLTAALLTTGMPAAITASTADAHLTPTINAGTTLAGYAGTPLVFGINSWVAQE
jgi:cobalamin biosynthesis protein CobD/CbiB